MKLVTGIVCGALIIGCLTANAKEVLNVPKWAEEFKEIAEDGSPKDVDWQKEAKLGSKGNVKVFFDKKGNPEVYIIGRAPIVSFFNEVDAEDDADEEAEFKAKAAFAIWLTEKFSVKTVNDRKALVVEKGRSDSFGKSEKSKQGENVKITKRHAEQAASGCWRGMRKFAAKRTKNEYIVVWRWSLSEHRFANLVEMLTKDGRVGGNEGRGIETFDWTFRK